MTGVLGKRTKFQQENFAQLTVNASSKLLDDAQKKETRKPKEVELNDDQLLSKVKFVGDHFERKLTAIDQCILLTFWQVKIF